jgi:CRP-like cAMP-binding protein
MNYETLFQKMETYLPVGYALKSYLQVALEQKELTKNDILNASEIQNYPILFIEKGNFKTVLESLIEPDQKLLRFHFEGNFLVYFLEPNHQDYKLTIRSIGETKLICIPSKHIFTLYKVFPEFHQFMQRLYQTEMIELFHHSFDIKNLTGDQRFERLMEIRPDIFQIAPSTDIAKSIGVHSHTLSTLKMAYFAALKKKKA